MQTSSKNLKGIIDLNVNRMGVGTVALVKLEDSTQQQNR